MIEHASTEEVKAEIKAAREFARERQDDCGCDECIRDIFGYGFQAGAAWQREQVASVPEEQASECSCGGVPPFHYDKCPAHKLPRASEVR